MRQIIYCVLLVVVWICSMVGIIWVLNFGGIGWMLIAGGTLAAFSTVALAEEFVEWRSRPRRKGQEASPVRKQLRPPAGSN
jgi:hypothetical protein